MTAGPVNDARILLVEDDSGVAALTRAVLEREGYRVTHEPSGAKATARILAERPDLVILDVMLPGEDGFTICRRVRSRCPAPILMFTARGDEIDQVVGLEVGADDYLPKTASPRLMLARVRALLRRAAVSEPHPDDGCREVGPLSIDRRTRRAHLGSGLLELTTAEFDLLWLLAGHVGEVVDRDALYSTLRGIEYDGRDRSVDVLVSRLRRRLADGPVRITTVRGAGYLLAVHER